MLASLLLAGAAGGVLFSIDAAHADIAGDCGATLAGTDLAGVDSNNVDDAIDVDYNDTIQTTMTSATGFESHVIKLRFLGAFERTVEEREDDGEASFTEEVDVGDYAWLGVGLYKVRGEANVVGGFACSGSALVNVTGRNPVTTVLGGGATGVAVAGTVGAVATGVASLRRPGRGGMAGMVEEAFGETRTQVEDRAQDQADAPSAEDVIEDAEMGMSMGGFGGMLGCLCFAALSVIMLPLLALTGGGGAPAGAGTAPPAPPRRTVRRVRREGWHPRITLVGLVSGLLTGLAGVILMQQFAIAYPTTGIFIIYAAIGAVAYGIVVPTVGYTVGWLLARGRAG
ncbi:MAG: hypothetical protein WEB04_06895 [Dehalococcoidia bacterium]